MKKLCVAVVLFAVGIVFVAVWFSPLVWIGEPTAYYDNMPVASLDGLCYRADELVRVDFSGGEEEMYAALSHIGASQTDREETDGMIVVYAFSPRVCAATQSLANGAKYNVMACLRDGHISVGTPVLSGCY
ncbi:MAG: hypothetical protein K2O94_04045 [Clostridiales bacterium]|uniref:hypothetical protein n=1 Tax=Anaerocaecibacter muris TaxID=2941513 RepID=UPI00203DAF87|nr:hypothetical protein [Anaerocaecibacter muris]MDE6966134.1 hypothetical protein [Clostridiales bacterium]